MHMKISKNNNHILFLAGPICLLILVSVLVLVMTAPRLCQAQAADIAKRAEQHVEKAIQIQKTTHKNQVKWEQEKSDLVHEYENLVQQKQALENENQTLAAQQRSQEILNQTLIHQKNESIRIANELIPFLNDLYSRLDTFVKNDSPFLKKERTHRLATLSRVMKDPEVTVSEKYRKVMEALFIEAEYGTTIEVYQDKILMASARGEQTLGNIFRLGRVSLFFLSLDQAVCGVYSPDRAEWQILPDAMLPSIRSAVEIGSKRRPVELLSLPIGRLAAQGGDQ
jgi:hypothetical protein